MLTSSPAVLTPRSLARNTSAVEQGRMQHRLPTNDQRELMDAVRMQHVAQTNRMREESSQVRRGREHHHRRMHGSGAQGREIYGRVERDGTQSSHDLARRLARDEEELMWRRR